MENNKMGFKGFTHPRNKEEVIPCIKTVVSSVIDHLKELKEDKVDKVELINFLDYILDDIKE